MQTEDLARSVPCRMTTDFLSDSARELIYRFCKPWFEANKLSVSELLHSASWQNKFMSAGAYYSNAVQKIALAQIEKSRQPIQERVKELYALCDAIVTQSRQDIFNGKPPALNIRNIVDMFKHIESVCHQADQVPAMMRALANAMSHEQLTLDAKLTLVVEQASLEWPVSWLEIIDMFIADLLRSAAVLREMMLESPSLHVRMIELIDVWRGTFNHPQKPVATQLAKLVAGTGLSSTRLVLQSHIINGIESRDQLVSDHLESELDALHDIAARLRDAGGGLATDDMQLLAESRCDMMLSAEAMTLYLKDAEERDDKAKLLIELLPRVVGAKSRKFVLTYIERVVGGWAERIDARGNRAPTLQTLSTVALIRRYVSQAEMPDSQREKLLKQQDIIFQFIDKQLQPLEKLAQHLPKLGERGMTLLMLIRDGAFQGKDLERARNLAKEIVRHADFMPNVLANYKTEQEQKRALLQLLQLIQQSGIA